MHCKIDARFKVILMLTLVTGVKGQQGNPAVAGLSKAFWNHPRVPEESSRLGHQRHQDHLSVPHHGPVPPLRPGYPGVQRPIHSQGGHQHPHHHHRTVSVHHQHIPPHQHHPHVAAPPQHPAPSLQAHSSIRPHPHPAPPSQHQPPFQRRHDDQFQQLEFQDSRRAQNHRDHERQAKPNHFRRFEGHQPLTQDIEAVVADAFDPVQPVMYF